MRRLTPLLAALATATAAVVALGFATTGASAAVSAGAGAAGHGAGGTGARPLPYQVFAPYYETYDTSGDMAAQSQQSGAKFLSLAFLETATAGSCTAYWNGDTTEPIAASSFGADIAEIQHAGGNVIPSFGGYTADTTNTDIADSCTSVPAIAKVYESLITTYHVPRIDLDVEGTSVSDTAGINRRNEAIAMTEAWAAAHHRTIQFSYTLPTVPSGLPAAEFAVLQNAVADGARISTVNLLTFDYYIGTQQDMVADTETAADGLYSQLQSLYPTATPRQLWHMIGVTEMPGIDDFGPDETFSTADAITILHWAQQQGIGLLSFWALQRDNGGCPGTKGAGTCSGVSQPDWYFSHVFEHFTR
ncbi:MAG TPA: chitinase [Streptosporangiaceae bacterium]|jgi:Glycosyl hydrolases family 18|nr:chitinase [Streptosporangiaceae bacterium]